MRFPEESQKNFISEMSEQQIAAREFFSPKLLSSLEKNFGLNNACIICFDRKNRFISWIDQKGIEHGGSYHRYRAFSEDQTIRDVIYREALRDRLTHMNNDPRLYVPTAMMDLDSYEMSDIVREMEKQFGMHYCAIMAFGKSAYLEIVCFKSSGEGDFLEDEIDELKTLYTYVAQAYKNFKKHEQTKIITNIQDEIIENGADSYFIADDDNHVLVCNKKARICLEEILGKGAIDEYGIGRSCGWLPFLLGDFADTDGVRRRIVRGYTFDIHTYRQTYSHDIVDSYYWITVRFASDPIYEHKIEAARHTCEESPSDQLPVDLTPAEKRVMELVCRGMTYKQAAAELGVSYHTVKNQVQKIFAKCGIKSRFELYELKRRNLI